MKRTVLLLLLASSLVTAQNGGGISNKPDLPKYTPTHEQQLELENAQLRAQLAQGQIGKAQQLFQGALNTLTTMCKSVAATNKWPSTVECNLDTLVFEDKPAPTKDEVKPVAKPSNGGGVKQ